jgi:hypothetical protein
MEQVLPGEDPDDLWSDPIVQSNDLREAGKHAEAKKILMDLCQADLRCLDAHSHLGHFTYHFDPSVALRHFEVGFRIGELALGSDFTGVLPWGHIDNRRFCAACTASGCACGVSGGLTRRSASLTGCSG